jgi:hypothetical protein
MVTSFLTQPEIVMVRPAVAALAALMATGVVFKLVPKSGGGSAYKVPQRFPGNPAEGAGGLTFDKAANLYGATGIVNGGVFEITP